ncbi:sulfotransferase [Candidatus Chloroploca sp. Khr17]|uniref:sulfotransferase n=1 Tax=Candidatus Chloroploca sp. Khr17 TaxID=2496869 RepID=UPI00101DDDF2|nr:sulfotransferase [Candidatus Chloroploca sp. Khr17]
MNFVVYGQARTGSTLLVRLLQSHPQIQCAGEILSRGRWHRHVKRYLHTMVRHIPEPYVLWEASRTAKDTFGFKLLHNQVPVSPRLMSNLHRHGWQLIHIQRRNLFDVAISRQVAERKRHWGEYKPSLQEDRIEIPPEDFLRQLQQCVALRQKERYTLADLPHLSVVYEDDLLHEEDRQRICTSIFAALCIAPHQVATTKKRSWDRPYSELVTNYAELQALMETEQGQTFKVEWEKNK